MLYELRRQVENSVTEALEHLDLSGEPDVELAPEDVDAVLASSTAFKQPGDPTKTAAEIADVAPTDGLVGDVEALGPYVNYTPSEEYYAETLRRSQHRDYPALPERDESVLLEHTSANPTGPLHVGRARNPIIGDSLARLLRLAGYEVEVEYYVNDVGRQVATITWALDEFDETELGDVDRDKPDHDVVRYYRRANEVLEGDRGDEAAERAEEEIDDLLRGLERGDDEAHERVTEAVERCLDGQMQTLERLGATYDSFVRESEFVLDGSVDDVSDALKRDERCTRDGDAYALDLTDHGIDKELVFLRADGTSLYTTRDIAYHVDKFSRSDRAVNVLGEDHRLQARQLGAALDVLDVDRRPENIFYSYVNLPEGKMSTRAGTVVDVDDLLDEAVERARREIELRSEDRERSIEDVDEVAKAVGVGAVRFDVVARQPEKPITFRWEEALDFTGQHAPYVQYVHARASGILENAVEPEPDVGALVEPEARALVEKVAEMSYVVDDAASGLAPHRVATYSRELAESFNEFYRECQVVGSDREAERAALVRSARNAIAGSLDVLGVDAPEAM
ncbi:MAG: arginine--tRNA ligase [Halobacteriales archaeon]